MSYLKLGGEGSQKIESEESLDYEGQPNILFCFRKASPTKESAGDWKKHTF